MKGYKIQIMNDSAVSEAVGFILIFGIMLSGIGLIALYGYPMLLQEQQNTNTRNMERNMILLQSDMNSLVYKSVPYKETTMQVSGGVLSVKSPDPASSFTISDAGGPLLGPFQSGELHFLSDAGDINLGLENGAVVKSQAGGSVMLSEPRWFVDTSSGDTLVITLIQVDDSGSSLAKTGISTVRMSIEPWNFAPGTDGVIGTSDDKNIIDIAPAGAVVKITIPPSSPDSYHTAWINYLEKTLGMTPPVPPEPDTWEKQNLNRVVIKAWKITVISL